MPTSRCRLHEASGPRAPFTWEARPEPVIARGDSSDVLNPSVVRFQGAYWNLYSEFDGRTWHTAAATSPDGLAWTKLGRVLSPQASEGSYIAANGSALVVGDEILYWHEIGYPLRIALARSRDGKIWSRYSESVVPLGPRGSFDERAVADPYVIRAGDHFLSLLSGPGPRPPPEPGHRAFLRRRHLGEAAHQSDSRTRHARIVRRKRLGRARRMDLGRPVVDALHGPRQEGTTPSGSGSLS